MDPRSQQTPAQLTIVIGTVTDLRERDKELWSFHLGERPACMTGDDAPANGNQIIAAGFTKNREFNVVMFRHKGSTTLYHCSRPSAWPWIGSIAAGLLISLFLHPLAAVLMIPVVWTLLGTYWHQTIDLRDAESMLKQTEAAEKAEEALLPVPILAPVQEESETAEI